MRSRKTFDIRVTFFQLPFLFCSLFVLALFAASGCMTEMSRKAIDGAMSDVRAGMAAEQNGRSNDANPFSHESLTAGLPGLPAQSRNNDLSAGLP